MCIVCRMAQDKSATPGRAALFAVGLCQQEGVAAVVGELCPGHARILAAGDALAARMRAQQRSGRTS